MAFGNPVAGVFIILLGPLILFLVGAVALIGFGFILSRNPGLMRSGLIFGIITGGIDLVIVTIILVAGFWVQRGDFADLLIRHPLIVLASVSPAILLFLDLAVYGIFPPDKMTSLSEPLPIHH